jgi:hypothetical protein
MAIFDGFFDSAFSGATNPKGNLGDWQHASRLYVNDNFKHAPKSKFLYHVTFTLSTEAQSFLPELPAYVNEIGMLVKSADLPGFSANVETKNQYNRKKNVQTTLEYEPITIDFHDDNFGATTALLEAYFKYYYADSIGDINRYGTPRNGDSPYGNQTQNYSSAYGLDNNRPQADFFTKIEIAQMSKRTYTKYILVNPILSNWNHDSVDNSDSMGTMQNSITVNYDTVLYDRGEVEAGDNGEPIGFGKTSHYDSTPSPITTLGGGDTGIFGVVGGAADILGGEFNPFEAAISGVNIAENVGNLTSEGIRESGLNLATNALGNILTGDSGASDGPQIASSGLRIVFPQNDGTGGPSDVTSAEQTLSSSGAGGETTSANVSSTNGLDSVSQAQQNIDRTSSIAQQAADRRITGLESSIETFENDARRLREQGNLTGAARAEALAESRRADLQDARNQRNNIFGS